MGVLAYQKHVEASHRRVHKHHQLTVTINLQQLKPEKTRFQFQTAAFVCCYDIAGPYKLFTWSLTYRLLKIQSISDV